VGLSSGVKRALTLDNSLSVWFLKDDPMVTNYHKFQERFGNDEVVICVVNDSSGLLAHEHIAQFIDVTHALLALPDVASVIGPGSVQVLQPVLLQHTMKELMNRANSIESIQAKLDTFSLIKHQFFTHNYQSARFIITLKKQNDFDNRRDAILEQIKQTIHQHLPPDETYFGGIGIIYAGLNKLSQQDFGFFLLLGYGVMFCLILIIYRKPLLLIYALGTVGLSTYITLGIYGAFGLQLNLMTTLLPIIFVLVGIMDITHILNEQSLISDQLKTRKEIAFQSLNQLFKPGLFNSLTTAAGFLSLLTSPMLILRTFGLFAAIGILFCFFFTYLLGVIFLPYQSASRNVSVSIGPQLVAIVQHVLDRRRSYHILCFVILLIGLAGIYVLKNDTYTLGYFPSDNKVVTDHRQMEKLWGAYLPIDFLIEPDINKKLNDRTIVQNAMAFSDSVQTLSKVDDVFGFHTVYLIGLQQYHPLHYQRLINSQGALDLASKNAIRYYPNLMNNFVHDSSQTGRITFFGKMTSAVELQNSVDSVNRFATLTFGKNANVSPTGYQPMYATITQYVTSSQTYSLFSASVLIFALLWLFLRDIKLAFLAVVSNYFPIVVMLGIMGLAGINLDTATSSIAVIVLSICVDDTVHYMYKYKDLRAHGLNPTEARMRTTLHIGPAVIITGLLLFCGYAFMMLGSLQTVKLFGALTAIAIAAGLFGEFIVLPLLLERFDR
jgi:predicted RND superfamily exporter protein